MVNLTRPDPFGYFQSSHKSHPFLSDNRLEPRCPGLCRTGLRQLTATSLERPIKQEAAKWVMQIYMSI